MLGGCLPLVVLAVAGTAPSVIVLIHWGPNFITVPDIVVLLLCAFECELVW